MLVLCLPVMVVLAALARTGVTAPGGHQLRPGQHRDDGRHDADHARDPSPDPIVARRRCASGGAFEGGTGPTNQPLILILGVAVPLVRDACTKNPRAALAQADLGIAIGAGTDVAIETADVVLMRSDPLHLPTALWIGRGTLRKKRQNFGWAVGYSAALPIAVGVFASWGLVLRPKTEALSVSDSSAIGASTL